MEKRRGAIRQPASAGLRLALAAGLAANPAFAARACELPAGKRLESAQLALSYRTVPAKIVAGEHFQVFFAVCPKAGVGPSDTTTLIKGIKVDASMPEHRHGMNYRPSVVAQGAGYRSEGWMFHMPGRWEIVFEIGGERLADSVSVE